SQTSSPMIGFHWCMYGLSWFGVVWMVNFPVSSMTSHAQPEPKTLAAAFENASLNFGKSPNVPPMTSPRLPLGSPPPVAPPFPVLPALLAFFDGAMIVQK